jgi:alpha-tubulin suppressor-like RCC1 family protein
MKRVAALAICAGCTNWDALSRDSNEESESCATYVVAGDVHSCVRKANGSLFCWGDNRFGQLGTGDSSRYETPTRVDFGDLGTQKVYVPTGNGNITSDVAVFTCVLASDNAFWCWGDNRFGQLGSGTAGKKPSHVNGLPGNVSKAAAGSGHVCVQSGDGALFCWGRNIQGQLGVGNLQSRDVPALVDVAGQKVERISAGGDFTCARTTDASLFCWGANTEGQLGIGTTLQHTRPVEVVTLGTRVGRIATGGAHACAFTEDDGLVWCWGDNGAGQLGLADTARRLVPTLVDPKGLGRVKTNQILTGGMHTCALRDDSTLWCWGSNRFGQLGTGDTSPRQVPTQVAVDVAGAATGGAHTCVIKLDGSVGCWGNNQYGQLGVSVGSQSVTAVTVMPGCH